MADIAMTVALAKALGGGGGGGGGVEDVLLNGQSIVNAQGEAEIPLGGYGTYGVFKIFGALGVDTSYGNLAVSPASDTQLKAGVDIYKPVVSANQHTSAFYALAKAAGDSTQSASANAVGTYTETAKSAISQMLNAPETVSGSTPSVAAKPGVQYICGEVSTIDITVPESGIIDVIFESGSTPAVLTVTPPTGMTMKWASGFDPTNLEANTTYEINIMNGCLGVGAAWT